ncbi:MAG: tetratricopeptide repeat protein [Streptosporangiales bacterium]|nr:tetratricopeptide repeat protein [Streptosporangiales bacterium]
MSRETEPVSVYFRLLGPLRVTRDGREVSLPAAKERVVLAALLLAAGRAVSVEQLIDSVWGDSPIATARQSLAVYVYRLRSAVGEELIVSAGNGYRVDVSRCGLDLADFDALVEEAGEAEGRGDLPVAVARLRAALGLWRGDPLDDVASDVLHRHGVAALAERRLGVVEGMAGWEIALGRGRDTLVELRRLVAAHPLRERLWALLMRALVAEGQQAGALAAYRDITSRLAEELGIDPGAELREVHQAILTGTLESSPATTGDTSATVSVRPRQLPARPLGFVGRQRQVARLLSWFERDGHAVAVVSGPPGVGKSALAVTVGHLLAERFPDGQLFVDLRGFSAEQALQATDVLPRFLRALGMPADEVPVEVDEQSAAFRSATAGMRVLVVLDNAATPEQVRPLLPGGRECGVMVTSRDRLHSLVAIDGARALALDVLGLDEATAVLAAQTDAGRVTAESEAVRRIAELCGRLPLALRVAASHLALSPHELVSDYAAELDRGGRLHRIWAGDDGLSVTAAFQLSYAALDVDARRVFRQLGLVPGPGFTVDSIVALTGGADVRRHLEILESASLVHRQVPGRYRMHDLVRDFAGHQAETEDGAAACTDTRQRLFDWYVAKVDAALVPRFPNVYRLPRAAPDETMVEQTEVGWIEDELANLTAAVSHCVEHGPYAAAWHLTDALRQYLYVSGIRSEWATIVGLAQPLAEREAGPRVRAAMLLAHATLMSETLERDEALVSVRGAADLFAAAGDHYGEGIARRDMCIQYANASRHDDALAAGERALEIFTAHGHGSAVAMMTRNLALLESEMGRLTDAVADCERLLRLDDGTEDVGSRARIRSLLGYSLRRVGRLAEARAHLDDAVALFDESDHRLAATTARCDLARCLCDAGDYDCARTLADEAMAGADRDHDRENHVEAGAVLAEIDVRSRPPSQWRFTAPSAEEMEPFVGHPLYFRWLDVVGWAALFRGDHDKALEVATHTLAPARESSVRLAGDAALTVLTAALVGLGRAGEAIERGTEALRRHRETGYRLREARTLCSLGDACLAAGDSTAARGHWEQAHEVYTAIGTAEVAEASRRLGS